MSGCAVVTGATRGIGLAAALSLGRAGYNLALVARKQHELDGAVAAVKGSLDDLEVQGIAVDVGKVGAATEIFDALLPSLGPPRVLVNNAGTNRHFGPLVEIPEEVVDEVFAVNLRAPLYLSREFARRFSPQAGTGSLINIASVGGLEVEAGIGWYNVTKAGLIHLTRQLAGELGPHIRVNAISPGLVRTRFARALWEPLEESLASRLPMGRIGEPEDIGDVVAFLASDAARWMTGENIVVDGGNRSAVFFSRTD